jgi:hypothetical protein
MPQPFLPHVKHHCPDRGLVVFGGASVENGENGDADVLGPLISGPPVHWRIYGHLWLHWPRYRRQNGQLGAYYRRQ